MSALFLRNIRSRIVNSLPNVKNQNERLPQVSSLLAIKVTAYSKRYYNHLLPPQKWFCLLVQKRWSNMDRPPWERYTVASVQERVLNVCKAYDKVTADKTNYTICMQKRAYAMKPEMTIEFVKKRILLVLQLYDKVDPEKLTLDSHFINDLGLDSLDHVEVIMAMEDEFLFEIPEDHAERLMTPRAIAQYVCDREEVYE